uniref:Uncharacterized protein n=1 Tax=viral metagenome TaxID=1070528 RepID=A0A6H1ZKD1_9ZZZZ
MWDENKYPLGETPIFQNAISKTEEIMFVTLVSGEIHKALSDYDITREQWPWIRTKIINACQENLLHVLKSRQGYVEADPPEMEITFGPIPDDILDPKRWGIDADIG